MKTDVMNGQKFYYINKKNFKIYFQYTEINAFEIYLSQ